MKKKKWFRSRTIWANVVAIVAFFLANRYAIELDAEAQAMAVTSILGVMNIVLRVYTKQPVTK